MVPVCLALIIFWSLPSRPIAAGNSNPAHFYVNDPRYVGCYADRKTREESRIVPHARTYVQSVTPVTECVWHCRNHDFHYAALQWGNECRCGDERPDTLGVCNGTNCKCDRECVGNQARFCGGSWANSVYVTKFHDTRYLGCYRAVDLNNPQPLLTTEVTQSLPKFSIEECMGECARRQQMYAGVLDGGRCHCGNNSFQYRKFGACNWNCSCSSACPGNTVGMCGGPRAFSIYLAVPDTQFLGCFAISARDFGYTRRVLEQTASQCKYTCKTSYYKYKYAAVEYNGRSWTCACAQSLGYHRRCEVDSNCACSSRCPANATEICGGDKDSISVFKSGCPDGSFGPLCDQQCHCSSGACDVESGICSSGCASGWTGSTCATACPEGRHGQGCHSICSDKCLDRKCDRFTGQCLNCVPGRTEPPLCINECSPGSFGHQCRFKCRCANSENCNVETGVCGDGICAAGYMGASEYPACQEKCSGTFGLHCNGTCRCKYLSTCDHVTGMCHSDHCQAGYQGDDCQQVCNKTKFGESCVLECHCDGPCDRKTGCEQCASGWLDPPACQASALKRAMKVASGCLIPIFLVALLVLLFYWFCWRKRKTRKPMNIDMTNMSFKNLKEAFKRKSGIDNPSLEIGALYENCLNNRRVKLCDLEAHIFATKARENPFKAEYEALPKDFVHEPSPLGLRNDVKKWKNRFQNVIPYDHNRVPLPMEGNDDASRYINASFITDYHGNLSFIATQGPNEHTLRDFFRMIWEHSIPLVVMVTRFVEDGKIKCTPYWDEEAGRPKTIKEFVVTVIKENVYPDYTIRNLLITQGIEERTLVHFHFTGWPDHGVPDNANAMLNFHRRVRQALTGRNDTAVIHCSAGIGRTGTFLALDYLLAQAVSEGAVDVFGAVEILRRNRVNMVQNLDQYCFIYDAILEWHAVGFTSIPAKDFASTVAEWMKSRSKKVHSKIDEQYRLLEKAREATLDKEKGKTILRAMRLKNRLDDIVPEENYRVKLTTDATTCGDYINAVFVDGYRRPSAFIATQIPLPQTRIDMWRMVKDYNISCIVCFTDDKDNNEIGMPYWPEEEEEITDGPFTVTCTASNQLGNLLTCVTSDLTLVYNSGSIYYERHLRILNVMWYSERDSYGPTSDLLELLATVTRWQQTQAANTKVAVQSLHGCDKCGVFLAISNLIDMMNAEQEVDVFQVVKRIRKPRPQFIRSIEQYKYLYEVIEAYASGFHLYSNFS